MMRAVSIGIPVILLAIFPFVLSTYYLGLLIQVFIFAIFAMSLDLLVGYAGLPSLGHSAYFGAAAYTVAILSTRLGITSLWLGMAAGIAVTGCLAALFGLLAVRTKGAYFLLVTLALGQILWGLSVRWRSMTGSTDGLSIPGRPVLGLAPWSLESTHSFYYFVLIVLILAGLFLYVAVRSPFGYALLGTRDSESRMSALGYNTWMHKYLVFLIASVFAGLAGILFAYYNKFVSPDVLTFAVSAEGLLMVILGGAGTLFGPALGAGIIVFLMNLVSAYTTHWLLVLGLVYIVVVILVPKGIFNAILSRLGKRRTG